LIKRLILSSESVGRFVFSGFGASWRRAARPP
jgi:hypothetical protein